MESVSPGTYASVGFGLEKCRQTPPAECSAATIGLLQCMREEIDEVRAPNSCCDAFASFQNSCVHYQVRIEGDDYSDWDSAPDTLVVYIPQQYVDLISHEEPGSGSGSDSFNGQHPVVGRYFPVTGGHHDGVCGVRGFTAFWPLFVFLLTVHGVVWLLQHRYGDDACMGARLTAVKCAAEVVNDPLDAKASECCWWGHRANDFCDGPPTKQWILDHVNSPEQEAVATTILTECRSYESEPCGTMIPNHFMLNGELVGPCKEGGRFAASIHGVNLCYTQMSHVHGRPGCGWTLSQPAARRRM